MFKTIEECRLELVAHSVMVDREAYSPEETKREQALDFFPASAARVSFGKEDKTGNDPAADKKLMQYLATHQHMTPFEHQSAAFLVEVPLFIRSQIMRHRTFAYNEISRRYTEENLEFWIPTDWRKQATNNRQASAGELEDVPDGFLDAEYINDVERLVRTYELSLSYGVAREQARAILPQSLLTKFFMSGNLRNWAHFITLRTESHAQEEVRVVAERIENKLRELWPTAAGVLLGE